MNLDQLFTVGGIYSYKKTGFNTAAMVALAAGVFTALLGLWVPPLDFLYTLSWFTGFGVSYFVYYLMMKGRKVAV